jgi:hypothetical protein
MKFNYFPKVFFMVRSVLIAFVVLLSAVACAPAVLNATPIPVSTSPAIPPVSTPPSDSPVVKWHRDGGIAGFCDVVSIYSNGNAQVSSCKTKNPAEVVLTSAQLGQLKNWLANLKDFSIQQKDDAVADAMTVNLVFSGSGSSEATDYDRQSILSFVSEIALQANH